MPTTADQLTTAARDILLQHPQLTPSRAFALALERNPRLAAAHHHGEVGEAPAPLPAPVPEQELVDPGTLLLEHMASSGLTFSQACSARPDLAEAWNRGEYVTRPRTTAAPPQSTVEVARFKAPPIAADAIGSGTIKGLRIFRAGKWNNRTYTTRDLDAMVEAFPVIGYTPPVTLGHDDRPDAPAHGRVTRLQRVGEFLVADVEGIPAETMAMIREGRLLSLSAEIYFDLDRGGRKYSRALRSVALLGAHPPGVSGLPSLQDAVS